MNIKTYRLVLKDLKRKRKMQNYLGDWITKDGTEASITVIKNRIKGLQKTRKEIITIAKTNMLARIKTKKCVK